MYVKDSQTQISAERKNQASNELNMHSNQVQTYNIENETDKRVLTHVTTVSNRIDEETHQLPLQCTVPLKLNGVTSTVVPVNVENISSLMQVVPDNEMPRIQQFKLPMQVRSKSYLHNLIR